MSETEKTRTRTVYVILQGSMASEEKPEEYCWTVVGERPGHNREGAIRAYDTEQKGGIFKAVAKSSWDGAVKRERHQVVEIKEWQLEL